MRGTATGVWGSGAERNHAQLDRFRWGSRYTPTQSLGSLWTFRRLFNQYGGRNFGEVEVQDKLRTRRTRWWRGNEFPIMDNNNRRRSKLNDQFNLDSAILLQQPFDLDRP